MLKLGSHCSNAVAYGTNVLNQSYHTRYVYNSNFVHKNLLDRQYIDTLKSVCTYTSDSVSYSDIVKRKALQYVNKTGSQHIECTEEVLKVTVSKATPQRRKFIKGKITIYKAVW